MSFAGPDNLSRSSIFKVLLYFIACVAMIFMLFVHQVFVSSETFYHKQLKRELNSETSTFSMLADTGNIENIRQSVANRSKQNNAFTYRISSASYQATNSSYPAALAGNNVSAQNITQPESIILLPNKEQLVIGINPELLQEYRDTVTPMLLTGIAIPVILMLAGATLFAVSILNKLSRVNQGMNRVIYGEKGVKLPVSRNDDEFDILAIHLNFLIEQVEKKENSLKSLSVGMAHDLRTPIARMKLRLESLLVTNNSPHQNELEACHDDLEILLGMFNGMLEIANLNSGKQNIEKEYVDLSKISQDVIEFLLPISDEKKQNLYLRQDAPYHLQGEPSLLFRAIYNLVENAIKYTPECGEIIVIVDNFGLVVTDNGYGVSDKDKERIREPMFRVDRSRTHQGFGLGLSLVEAVIACHGGKLAFSDNNPGLRARLLLPPSH